MITLVLKFILFIIPAVANLGYGGSFIKLWTHWDSYWYLVIAQNWYQTAGKDSLAIVFFPLYPILIKIINFPIQNLEIASVLTAVFFSVTASIALFELSLMDYKKEVALKSVWFLNIFPTAYFLQAAYTESLFLTLSILSIYLIRKKYIFRGALFATLSSATRINGMLLLPTLLMETKSLKEKIICIFLAPLGFLFYLLINFLIFKKPILFFRGTFSKLG